MVTVGHTVLSTRQFLNLDSRAYIWYHIRESRRYFCAEEAMDMCQVSVNIPNEVLYDTHMNVMEATEFARRMVALGYYTQNNVSIGYCTKIAGMSEADFITFLGRCGVGIFDRMTEEELLRDVANA